MDGTLWMFLAFLIPIVIGVPVPIACGIGTAVGLYFVDIPFALLAQVGYQAYEPFPLLTIPLFILAGRLMQWSGMASRIIDIANALVGSYKGGLGHVSVLGCGFFAALSGSGPATTAAIGSVTIPAMKKQNYSNRFSGGIVAASGALGTMIPPSNMLVMYALVAEESIPRLFLGGIVPGLLLAGLIMLVCLVYARKCNYGGIGTFSWQLFLKAVWRGKWALGAPLLILGGIYSGYCTATEAASLAVFYSLFVGLALHRELTFKNILESLKFTGMFGGILLIMGTTIAFGQLVALYEIPAIVETGLITLTENPAFILLIIGLLFILLGMFMDSMAQVVIFTPVLLPVVIGLGIDPIFFGVMIALTSEIGFLTPPVGTNLFVSARILDDTLEEMAIGVLPFLMVYIFVLLLFCFFPDWVTWLPNLVYGSM